MSEGEGSTAEASGGGDRNLPLAIASGVLLVALLIGTVLWHPAAWAALVTVLALIGIVEAGRVCRDAGAPVETAPVVVALFVMMFAAYHAQHAGQAVGVTTLFVTAFVWELADPERRDVFRKIGTTLLLGLWVPFLASFALLLAQIQPDGWVATLATVGAAVANDVGAYAVGVRFGRHKLAPSVSPGKTWEGVVAGLAIAAILSVLTLPFLGRSQLFDPLSAFVFAVVVGGAGVLGDLSESVLKRDLGIKDIGGIIPGHGGVLDRMDAILLALPTGYFTLALLRG
ncbi:MAG: phosphatidate cytidylyltransferase [Nitriliruptorales bacterium]